MSFGKLFTYPQNPRSTGLLAIAKENNLDIELVETTPANGVDQEYLALNALGKVPTFKGADGFILTECMAIAIYFTSQNEKTTLLGKTKQDYASILKWMSFANTEVLPTLGTWFRPLLGRDPYNKKNVEQAQILTQQIMGILETHLQTRTFLVGERLTLADVFVIAQAARGFQYFFDTAWRKAHPNTTRWYELIYNQPMYKSVAGDLKFIDEALKNVAPKKEAVRKDVPKKESVKREITKKVESVDEEGEEEEAKSAPKPKHPLEDLPKPTLVLDDWKRKYSNEDTRSVALPWFWDHYKPDEYSLFKVDYKYNPELTHIFMSSNLIGGFFNRLEASRKYLFGAMSVYGQSNDSVISGVFLVRGGDADVAFNVAPDFDSYTATKLELSDKELVNDAWSWDKPLLVEGKSYEWSDGKVFK